MDTGAGVKTNPDFPIPQSMKAWVLGTSCRALCRASRLDGRGAW